jgi:dCTP deaminase
MYDRDTMAILTHDELLKRIESKEITVDPFDVDSVGPASIDFHLDNTFRVYKKNIPSYHVDKNINYKDITDIVSVDEFFLLLPGQTILGITKETLTLPPNLCGWIEGRSSLGRVGLTIHITASFIQPGCSNKQVLEINNMNAMSLALHPGIAVCQIILEETKGEASYRGQFQNQTL